MRDKLPSGTLDLKASYSRYAITAVNLLLGADIRLQIVAGDRVQAGHLLVTVDEGAVLAKRRKVAERIRERVTGKDDAPDRSAVSGLRLPKDWAKSNERQLLVIVLHGFNSSPQRFEPLADAFRQQGLLSGTYRRCPISTRSCTGSGTGSWPSNAGNWRESTTCSCWNSRT